MFQEQLNFNHNYHYWHNFIKNNQENSVTRKISKIYSLRKVKKIGLLIHPVATYVPLMCATYIVWTLSPELVLGKRNPAFLQAVFTCTEPCWRKTNNYCMAPKGGRIWFVKEIIVCFNIFCPPTSAAYSSCPFLFSFRIFISRYFTSLSFKCWSILFLSK